MADDNSIDKPWDGLGPIRWRPSDAEVWFRPFLPEHKPLELHTPHFNVIHESAGFTEQDFAALKPHPHCRAGGVHIDYKIIYGGGTRAGRTVLQSIIKAFKKFGLIRRLPWKVNAKDKQHRNQWRPRKTIPNFTK